MGNGPGGLREYQELFEALPALPGRVRLGVDRPRPPHDDGQAASTSRTAATSARRARRELRHRRAGASPTARRRPGCWSSRRSSSRCGSPAGGPGLVSQPATTSSTSSTCVRVGDEDDGVESPRATLERACARRGGERCRARRCRRCPRRRLADGARLLAEDELGGGRPRDRLGPAAARRRPRRRARLATAPGRARRHGSVGAGGLRPRHRPADAARRARPRRPGLDIWRAPTDNDAARTARSTSRAWREAGLHRLQHRILDASSRTTARSSCAPASARRPGLRHARHLTLDAPTATGCGSASTSSPAASGRSRCRASACGWRCPPTLDTVELVRAAGPARRTGQPPPPASAGSRSTVDELQTPYVFPQENGNRAEVRWVRLTRRSGAGLRVEGAPHVRLHRPPLDQRGPRAAQHTDDLMPRDRLHLNLDLAQNGLGTRRADRACSRSTASRPGPPRTRSRCARSIPGRRPARP